MCHANNKKWKTTNKGRKRTTKSRKNQNIRRNGNLQILGNVRSGYKIKQYLRRTRNLLEIKLRSRNLIKWINTFRAITTFPCGTIASRHLVGRWSRDYHMCRLVFLCFFPRPRCFQIRGKRRWMWSSRVGSGIRRLKNQIRCHCIRHSDTA